VAEIALKGGVTTSDPRLDWVPRKDEASRGFGVVAKLEEQAKPQVRRSRSWKGGVVTDQGREGACVGHGYTGFLNAMTQQRRIAQATPYAFDLYHRIQHRDPWAGCSMGRRCPIQPSGEQYDGTSTLDGAKELKDRGEISEYRWAFGLEQVILALGNVGPVVLGIPWYDSMYDAPNGELKVSGSKVGGHCILARGVSVTKGYVILRNSWGPDWGLGGDARISFDDLGRLLADDGEAVVPIKVPTDRLKPA
jgi:hypothetical protein